MDLVTLNFDLLIKGGRVIDGTGNPWFKADIGVEDGKILEIGDLNSEKAERIIKVSGLIVCPGFINIHTHTEPYLVPGCESSIMQGITLELTGNCGISSAPATDLLRESYPRGSAPGSPSRGVPYKWDTIDEWIEDVEEKGISINIASLIGHGTIRTGVLGFEDRAPTKQELEKMKSLVGGAMEDGAFGMSTGTAYLPGMFAKTEEIMELQKVAAKYGGIYTTHERFDSYEAWITAIKESIKIGEKTDSPICISHIAVGPLGHPPELVEEALDVIEAARSRGVDVKFDQVPYAWGGGGLNLLLPRWANEGGPKRVLKRLKDPEMRERIKISTPDPDAPHCVRNIAAEGHWDSIWIADSEAHPELDWMTIEEIAEEQRRDPWEVSFDMLIDEIELTGVPRIRIRSGLYNEEQHCRLIKHPAFIFEYDSACTAPYGVFTKEGVHPRVYGTYPLIFRKYVRGETRPDLSRDKGVKLLTVEEAVKKSTTIAAQMMGVWDRGLIRPGFWADITVFDLENITDKGTYQMPHQYPEGIRYVLVNGVVVVDEGEHTGARPGKFLRGPGYKPKKEQPS